ncbi:hypothetical protein EVA_14211 [gut metagenome]|uniref:Uncharacterized protein n=1 Tax=gut metagenome TaxID=749906 RepID=J9G7D3_9ZZZZ
MFRHPEQKLFLEKNLAPFQQEAEFEEELHLSRLAVHEYVDLKEFSNSFLPSFYDG